MSQVGTKTGLVLVYSGDGGCYKSILSIIKTVKATMYCTQVRQLNGTQLLEGLWQETCNLLIFPGTPGAIDTPYCRVLNGHGNFLIKDYVANGGAYLGICAGGYHACRRVEFELHTPKEVKDERELSFFPGVARGGVHPGFEESSPSGYTVLEIQFQDHLAKGDWQDCSDFSNGGPAFVPDNDAEDVEVIARYTSDDIKGAAAVKCKMGDGVAVLCGTHPEMQCWWLDAYCDADYMQRNHPDKSKDEIINLVLKANSIRGALLANQERRADFWRCLLMAAGMESRIR